MSYKVLALRKRPRRFEEVVGQATVTRTLENSIAAGRIGHAFLLSGARGVGKTTTARILAKALNCSASDGPTPKPCLACVSCLEIERGNSLDVQEIDGASNNSVENVRELRESARYNPARDRFKIWIIDEVHMLSGSAFNALLKTLEEPPPRVKFIFATTEYHKIPETILSRCQQYDFRMIPTRELQAHLRKVADEDGIEVSDHALEAIARAAEGSVRDALSLFEQVLAFSGEAVKDEDIAALLGLVDRELLYSASAATLEGQSLALLELVEKLGQYGADYKNFARELLLHFRELLLLKLAPEGSSLVSPIGPEAAARMRPVADGHSEEDLLRAIDVLARVEGELRWAQDPRVTLEFALLKLAQTRKLVPFAELVARLEALSGGAPAPRSQAAPAAPKVAKPAPSAAPPASSDAGGILAAMLEAASNRPSLTPVLRSAGVRLEADTLVLSVAPEFVTLAENHSVEYTLLATEVSGRKLKVRVEAGAAAAGEKAPPPASELRRERMRKEAEREPAVQEALSLFSGKVVDVRESE